MKKSPISNQSVQLISDIKSNADGQNISITYDKLIGDNNINSNTSPGDNLTESTEYSRYSARACLPRSVSRSPRAADAILQSSETLVPQSSPIPLLSPRREHQPSQPFYQNPQNSQNSQKLHSHQLQLQQQQQQQLNTHLISFNGNPCINNGNIAGNSNNSNNNNSIPQDENEVMPPLSFLANFGRPLVPSVSPEKTTPLIVPSSDTLTFTGTPYTGFIPAPAETVCEAGRKTPSIIPTISTIPTIPTPTNSSATISPIPNSITPSSFHLTSPFGMVPCIDLNENLNIANNVNNIRKIDNNNNNNIYNNNNNLNLDPNIVNNNNNINPAIAANNNACIANNSNVCVDNGYLRQIESGNFNPSGNQIERRNLDLVRTEDNDNYNDDDDEYEDDDDEYEEEEDEYEDDYDMENEDEDHDDDKDGKTKRGISNTGRKRSSSSKKIRGPRNNDFIQDSRKRGASFCKRRDGLIKKFCEITKLTETEGFILIRSPTGMLFWGATPQMERVAQMKDVSKYFLSQAPPPVPRKVRRPNRAKKDKK